MPGWRIVIAGIAGSSAWTEEKIVSARPGQSFELAGYKIALDAVNPVSGPDYAAIRADMRLMRDGREIAALHPERRNFANGTATHVAIRTNLLADVYAVIGEADGNGAYVLRLYYNPLVPWIWLGAVVMALGGLVSLSDRRHRVGAPARRAGRSRRRPRPRRPNKAIRPMIAAGLDVSAAGGAVRAAGDRVLRRPRDR